MCGVSWDDRGLWPAESDGTGHSLVLRDPNRFIDDYRNWTFSSKPGGTPGAPKEDRDSLQGVLLLSEVHIEDGRVDWIEVHNAGLDVIDLADVRIASRKDFSDKVELQGNLSAGGWLTFDCGFIPDNDGRVSLHLVREDGTVLDAVALRRLGTETGFEEFPAGSGEWFRVDASSKGQANNPARETSVVINELMIDPPSDQVNGEYIELYNKGNQAVNLAGWHFTDGINYTFPTGTVIEPGAYLVVAGDQDRMKQIYGNIPVIGNYSGSLANTGENLSLADARGNVVDRVHYQVQGDWPDWVNGGGSSMELVNPEMDNSHGSAWRDSDESAKPEFYFFSYSSTYQEWDTAGSESDYKELHMFLTGDGEVIIDKLSLQKNGTGANIIENVDKEAVNGNGSTGWICQGTHSGSYVDNQGRLHIISTGHGDNKANRIEIDITDVNKGDNVTVSFHAKWVKGRSRLIVQSWDHSIGSDALVHIPDNLGTPGLQNSRHSTTSLPQINRILHSPAVPKTSEKVTITADVTSVNPLAKVELVYRPDNSNANSVWETLAMKDDGTAPDALAGDGTYSVLVEKYRVDHQVIQFYVRATDEKNGTYSLPKQGKAWPAMFIFDNDNVKHDLSTHRFILSEFDREAIRNGNIAKFNYKLPPLSNQYKNLTFIFNEKEVYYGGEVRAGGSPWHRRTSADLHARGKWKLPKDRLFRNRIKSTWDNNGGNSRYHNRIVWYWFYLYDHAFSEHEFMRMYINGSGLGLREDVEPNGNNLLDRQFENGADGQLIRIDDEWFFQDNWSRGYRSSEWYYKYSENAIHYHSEWMMRSREQEYDYGPLIQLFRMVTENTYTEEQINRILDPVEITKHSAIRGYIGDWDSFTLGRGKNSFMYRRSTDGRFQFLTWDSDLAFRENNEFYNGREFFKKWIEKPYNMRLFYHFLEDILLKYSKNSARLNAWLEAERDASSQYDPDINFYHNFFNNRESRALNLMGGNRTIPFTITSQNGQDFFTDQETEILNGTAPVKCFSVRVEGHPEATVSWNGITNWSNSGIQLREGDNHSSASIPMVHPGRRRSVNPLSWMRPGLWTRRVGALIFPGPIRRTMLKFWTVGRGSCSGSLFTSLGFIPLPCMPRMFPEMSPASLARSRYTERMDSVPLVATCLEVPGTSKILQFEPTTCLTDGIRWRKNRGPCWCMSFGAADPGR